MISIHSTRRIALKGCSAQLWICMLAILNHWLPLQVKNRLEVYSKHLNEVASLYLDEIVFVSFPPFFIDLLLSVFLETPWLESVWRV
jgi:hypothetical protein